ncbi:MAG TPA: orotidine-5'-phosphate decarboxylase [Polyangia bacterium]|jgi:orotidine-5'-phosphate decarboxylase
MKGIDRLIVALDHPSLEAALLAVDRLGDAAERYKVGLELYLAAGARAVEELTHRGKRVFLDLKLHDIPETVRRAAKLATADGVDLLTVHASGGRAMLAAAVEGAGARARVLAVTVLTSLDAGDLVADGNPMTVEDLVARRALLAEEAGCAGVIASPREVAAIRQVVRPEFLIVTPGIRPQQGGDDQKRTATAREARAAGADAVVVGRPIRDAASPRAVALALIEELS